MVIFSHRGIGFGKNENSIDAINTAAGEGVSIEVDLRLKNGNVVLAHDDAVVQKKENDEFIELLKINERNRDVFVALHLKENSDILFNKVTQNLRKLHNYFIFATDFDQPDFIKRLSQNIGPGHLALYIKARDFNRGLADMVNFFWLDETQGDIYKDLDYFAKFNKKIVCCSPELFSETDNARLDDFRDKIANRDIFGVCTDYPDYYTGIK